MPTDASLRFILSMPEGAVADLPADTLLLTTPEGDIALRPQHEKALLAVKPGEVVVYMGGKKTVFTTAGGTLFLENNTATLLTSFAAPAAEYKKKLDERMDILQQRYSQELKSEADLRRVQMALHRSLVQKQ